MGETTIAKAAQSDALSAEPTVVARLAERLAAQIKGSWFLMFSVSVALCAVLPLGLLGLEAVVWAAEAQAPLPQPRLRPLGLTCSEGQILPVTGIYRADNNAWGKGNLKGWRQCIGIGAGAGHGVQAH